MPDLVSDYCIVDGPGIGELTPLITNAFIANELEELVRITFSEGLYQEYVPSGLTDRDLVFTLLEALGRRGTTVIFLRAVRKSRPAVPDLIGAIARHCPAAANDAAAAETQVNRVLESLKTLKSAPVRAAAATALAASRENLEGLAAGFEVLRAYKVLHDALQKVQLLQYRQLVEDVKRLRDDPLVSLTIEPQLTQLDLLADAAMDGANGLPDTPRERRMELRWIRGLKDAVTKLRDGVAALDDRAVTSAVSSIKDVIRTQPFRVNGLLTATAESLPLDDLIKAIEAVQKVIPEGDPAHQTLDSGLRALQDLFPRLRGQVSEHDLWQEIENELWSADQAMEAPSAASLQDFALHWEKMKPLVDTLCRASPQEAWVINLQKFSAQFEPPDDTTRIRIAYGRFRNQALLQFSRVDLALKSLCGEVLRLGQPLNSLLSEVSDG